MKYMRMPSVSSRQRAFRSALQKSEKPIYVIVIGFLAGLVAKLIMPGKDPGGFIITTVLGMAGALVATFLGRLVGWYREREAGGFIAAVVAAIIILFVYRIIKKRTA